MIQYSIQVSHFFLENIIKSFFKNFDDPVTEHCILVLLVISNFIIKIQFISKIDEDFSKTITALRYLFKWRGNALKK